MTDTVAIAEALARQSRVVEAFRLLEAAVAAGDAQAALTLADWRMAGNVIRRDLGEARRLYGRAAELGIHEAEPVHIAMLANGAGGAGRDWPLAMGLLQARASRDSLARAQAGLVAAMAIDADGNPLASFERHVIRSTPRIERLRQFLTTEECIYIAALALPRLAPAVVVDPRTGQQIRDPIRTGLNTAFPFVDEDPVLYAINRRIAAATETAYEQGEPLQVLSYEAGQQYKLHSDTLPAGANQRVMTFLIGLNDGYAGGETSFPRLGLNLRLAAGDALLFENTDAAGNPDQAMWHAGLPVTRGRKLLVSRWIREKPLDLSGPPGRPF